MSVLVYTTSPFLLYWLVNNNLYDAQTLTQVPFEGIKQSIIGFLTNARDQSLIPGDISNFNRTIELVGNTQTSDDLFNLHIPNILQRIPEFTPENLRLLASQPVIIVFEGDYDYGILATLNDQPYWISGSSDPDILNNEPIEVIFSFRVPDLSQPINNQLIGLPLPLFNLNIYDELSRLIEETLASSNLTIGTYEQLPWRSSSRIALPGESPSPPRFVLPGESPSPPRFVLPGESPSPPRFEFSMRSPPRIPTFAETILPASYEAYLSRLYNLGSVPTPPFELTPFDQIGDLISNQQIAKYEINPLLQPWSSGDNRIITFTDRTGQIYHSLVRFEPTTQQIYPPS